MHLHPLVKVASEINQKQKQKKTKTWTHIKKGNKGRAQLNQTPKKEIGTKTTPSSLTFPSECLHRSRLSISIGCVLLSPYNKTNNQIIHTSI